MSDFSSSACRVRWPSSCPARLLVALAWLLALLPALAARAQAPSWQLALAPTQLVGGISQTTATATDAAGNVYLTGTYSGQVQFGSTLLTSVGGDDVFVACYRPASGTWTWATSGGGLSGDVSVGIATDGTRVYITGYFFSNTSARFAGQTLTGAGNDDAFVAAYAANTGAGVWATSGGGTGSDAGRGIATDGTRVYVTGSFTSYSHVSFAGQDPGAAGGFDAFVAAYAADTGAGAWATSGGGTGSDGGRGIATDGARVYVTGIFASNTNADFAGQTLAGAGSTDTFVAAYAAGTGAGAWATSGGGTGSDAGAGIATDGTRVYVTGTFTSNTSAGFAGQTLAGAGSTDTFVAAYAAGTGAGAWATSGGGTGADAGQDIATDGTRVYVTGAFTSNTSAGFAGQTLAGAGNDDAFVAAYAAGTGAGAWATSSGGTGSDLGQGIAVGSGGVYTGVATGIAPAPFGGFGLLPPRAAGLVTTNKSTGAGLGAIGPLTGGTSVTQATATDAAGNVYLTGAYTGQVQFGSTLLTSVGSKDVFVACYRPASGTWAWATSGGGPGTEFSTGIATDGTRVYITGSFASNTGTRFAGQALAGAGNDDAFVAAYSASTGAGAWATSGGGTGTDAGAGIATDGTRVYVTGYFTSNTGAGFAGQTLAGAGSFDAFVAAYAAGTGTGAWATSGGGTAVDVGYGIATDGTRVYVAGTFESNTSAGFAGQALAGAGSSDAFVAAYAAGTGAGGWATSGGGTSFDAGQNIATDGTRVYVAGYFYSNSSVGFAGQPLAGAGSLDAFAAAYVAGTGAGVWATSGGGGSDDRGYSIATDGTRVYMTGYFASNTSARFAGQALAGAGNYDAFVAAYAAGTGASGGAVSGGGPGNDQGTSIAVGSAGSVWVGGFAALPATFGATTLAGSNKEQAFLGQLYTPGMLATAPGAAAVAGLVLYPNPAAATQARTLELPAALSRYAATAVLSDALGRVARTQQLPASGGAVRTLAVAGLAPGLYVLRLHTPAGELSSKLMIE
jgi:hypothetical protein